MRTVVIRINRVDDPGNSPPLELYQVSLNGSPVTLFQHDVTKGLPACLRAAAIAAEEHEYKNWLKAFNKGDDV